MKDVNFKKDRLFLMKRMGHISQLTGLKRYIMNTGKARGIEAVDIKNGTGFSYTVLPGRGMDIAWASYRGVPVSYISKTGIVSPAYFEPGSINWLRNFFGGLLTTCGLSNVGMPCEDNDSLFNNRKYGLHGRISNSSANNICVTEGWQNNKFIMCVSGKVREAMLHCENFILQRKITTELGLNKIVINDLIQNADFNKQPLMILYHINIGYPILDEDSRFLCSSKQIEPANDLAEKNYKKYNKFQAPTKGYKERMFFHDLNVDNNGETSVGIVNDKLELGIYVKFNKKQLPRFTQWKMLNESEYVLGIEPGNCLPVGRKEQRERGELKYLEPGEEKEINLEIGILANHKEITQFEHQIDLLD